MYANFNFYVISIMRNALIMAVIVKSYIAIYTFTW